MGVRCRRMTRSAPAMPNARTSRRRLRRMGPRSASQPPNGLRLKLRATRPPAQGWWTAGCSSQHSNGSRTAVPSHALSLSRPHAPISMFCHD